MWVGDGEGAEVTRLQVTINCALTMPRFHLSTGGRHQLIAPQCVTAGQTPAADDKSTNIGRQVD